jgi:hypothetical protein
MIHRQFLVNRIGRKTDGGAEAPANPAIFCNELRESSHPGVSLFLQILRRSPWNPADLFPVTPYPEEISAE